MDVDQIAEAAEILTPEAVLDAVLGANENARSCLTSSFQAEDMAVLHLLRKRIPDVPVLFLDTGYHFPQTYEYRDRLAREWSLNLVNVLPVQTVAEQESAFGILNRSDPTRCCQLRKVEPLGRNETRMRHPHIFEADECVISKGCYGRNFFWFFRRATSRSSVSFFWRSASFLGPSSFSSLMASTMASSASAFTGLDQMTRPKRSVKEERTRLKEYCESSQDAKAFVSRRIARW